MQLGLHPVPARIALLVALVHILCVFWRAPVPPVLTGFRIPCCGWTRLRLVPMRPMGGAPVPVPGLAAGSSGSRTNTSLRRRVSLVEAKNAKSRRLLTCKYAWNPRSGVLKRRSSKRMDCEKCLSPLLLKENQKENRPFWVPDQIRILTHTHIALSVWRRVSSERHSLLELFRGQGRLK